MEIYIVVGMNEIENQITVETADQSKRMTLYLDEATFQDVHSLVNDDPDEPVILPIDFQKGVIQ